MERIIEKLPIILLGIGQLMLAIVNMDHTKQIKRLEKRITEIRVEIVSEAIQQALEPQLRAWGVKQEDEHGQEEQQSEHPDL